MKKIILMMLFLFFSFSLFCQENIEGKVIYKIIYRGLRKEKKRNVSAQMMTKNGMPLDMELLEQDYQNLLAMGSFEEVIISSEPATDEKTGVPITDFINLVLEFEEKPYIRKIIFRGNDNIPFGFLRGDITTKPGEFIKKEIIIGDIAIIEEKYRQKGFSYAMVDYEFFQNDELQLKNQVDLIFNITEGTETYIKQIIFNGNNSFTDFAMKNKMKTKERKFLGLQKGTFVENQFYQDIEELKKFYRDQGFFKVQILEPEINRYEVVEEEEKKEVIDITIQINEGNKYTYGGLEIEGNKVFDNEELTFPLKLKVGHVFNFSKFQEDIFSIQKKYNDYGYVNTTYDDDMVIDEEKKVIKVKLSIKESKRSYIEAVYFRGNTKTKNYVLYRAISTKVGDIFDYSRLLASYMSLQNLQFFSKIEWDIQPGSTPGLLKITYIVEEQSTAEVRFGMQISTTKWPPDFTLFGEINEKNLIGRQLQIGGKVDLSIYKQGGEFNFGDPWFLSYPWSLGGSFSFYHNWTELVSRDVEGEMGSYSGGVLTFTDEYNSDGNSIRDEYDDDSNDKKKDNLNYLNAEPGKWGTMGIHDITFQLGVNSGYRFMKYFSVSGGISVAPTFTFLPVSRDDPRWNILLNEIESSTVKNTIDHLFSIKSKLSTTFTINTTRRNINPISGLKFTNTAAYIFGHYDSLFLSSKFTYYFNILKMSFDNWQFNNVLVFNAAASAIFPGFRNLGGKLYLDDEESTAGKGPILDTGDYLFVDGVFLGRGWGTTIAGDVTGRLSSAKGYARFDFSLEYR
ncbi:MAG: outer membrane protein assembly factor BamA, partial [Spirochaetes bacterium]|nr:outer membrane protein assembly factor BamA [Spirochaetota bacterium]